MAARRVREHIEGALSKFEAAIESARQTLVTQIDGSSAQGAVCAKDFLEDYREWERWHHPPEDSETKQDEKREFFDSNWENLRSELFGLNRLKNYGYDLEMVVREAVAAGKLIAKEA
jgi:hypothetical protein